MFKNAAQRERYMALYDVMLRGWPQPFQELYLPTRFGLTHVVANGPADAPPLLLIPALMAGGAVWRPNIAGLCSRFRTYAVDVIGEPNKSRPERPLRSAQDCADWLNDVMDAIEAPKASLTGNSLGGFMALNQVVRSPERVDRVVLISPVGIAPIRMKLLALGGLSATFGIKGPVNRYLDNGVPPNPVNSDVWELSGAVSWSRYINARGYADFTDAQLAAIRNPVMLLIGDREVIYDPHATLEHAKTRIPGLNAQIVPGANHVAAVAQPDEVNRRILEFLDR